MLRSGFLNIDNILNVINNTRYVSLSRSIIGNDKDYYTFDTSVASIPLLEAIGYNKKYPKE